MYKNEIDTRPTRGAASSPGPHQTSKKFLWKNVQKFCVNMLTFFQFYIVPVMRLFSPLFLEREFFWCVSMPIPERERNVNNSSDGFLAMKVFGLMKRADWFQISFPKYCIKGGGGVAVQRNCLIFQCLIWANTNISGFFPSISNVAKVSLRAI